MSDRATYRIENNWERESVVRDATLFSSCYGNNVPARRRSAHINKLPHDVFFIIFSLVAQHYAEDLANTRPLTYPLNRVCRYWHATCLDVPVLHTRIKIPSVLPEDIAVLQGYLERSRKRLVDITVLHHSCPLGCYERTGELRSNAAVDRLRETLAPHASRISDLVLKHFNEAQVRELTALPLDESAVNVTQLCLSHSSFGCHLLSEQTALPPRPAANATFDTVVNWLCIGNTSSIRNLTALNLHIPTWTSRQLVQLLSFAKHWQGLLQLTLREDYTLGCWALNDMHSDPEDMVLRAFDEPISMPKLQSLSLQNLRSPRVRDVLSTLKFPLSTRVALDLGGHSGPITPVFLHNGYLSRSFVNQCRTSQMLAIHLLVPNDGPLAPRKTVLRYMGFAEQQIIPSWSAEWSWLPSAQGRMSIMPRVNSDLLDPWLLASVRAVCIFVDEMPASRAPYYSDWMHILSRLPNTLTLHIRLCNTGDCGTFFACFSGNLYNPQARIMPHLHTLDVVLSCSDAREQYVILCTVTRYLQARLQTGHNPLPRLRFTNLVRRHIESSMPVFMTHLKGVVASVDVMWAPS